MDGKKMHGSRRDLFELVTQTKNLIVDCAGTWVALITPNMIGKLISRKHATWILHEILEEPKFQRRESDCVAVAVNLHGGEVQSYTSKCELTVIVFDQ